MTWFPGFPWTSGKITDCATHDSTESIPVVLPAKTVIQSQKETSLSKKKPTSAKVNCVFHYWLSWGSFGNTHLEGKRGLADGLSKVLWRNCGCDGQACG
jgi:hypothetical protein